MLDFGCDGCSKILGQSSKDYKLEGEKSGMVCEDCAEARNEIEKAKPKILTSEEKLEARVAELEKLLK